MNKSETHRSGTHSGTQGKAIASRLPMRTFSHSLPMALLNTREMVMSQFRPTLRAYDLTEQQWRVIRALVELDKVEVTELAKRSFILSPSLSRILQKLTERGLVKRHQVASDQRRSLISISAKGRSLFATIAPLSEVQYAHIEAVFGSEKLVRLHKLLTELDDALASPSDPSVR
ncbi:MAG: homoprotocatechuate degradation regulator HpaR [Gammaproteobacteria bacterium]|jgi:homoprotocatechuate degradation regulator HpaR